METIAIINRKGGVGKTATALALGSGLKQRGYSVLYIDLDSQGNLSTGLNADTTGLSAMDVLEGIAAPLKAIQHTPQGDILPASDALAGADMVIKDTGREYRLKEAIDGLNYDYIIIDTPAALGTLTVNALTAAKSAIVPVQADIDSIHGLKQLTDVVDRVKKYCNRDLYINGLLLTRYSGRAVISRNMRDSLEKIAAQLKTRLYKTPIRECIAIKEAKTLKQDIFSYAPKRHAAKDYEDFVNEFLDV